MKLFKFTFFSVLAISTVLVSTSCSKTKAVGATETYTLKGKIDPTRTTISGATVTNAVFTISFNNANSFGDAQSLFSGNLKLAGYSYTGSLNSKDTCAFFATQDNGPAISYITAVTTAANTNSGTNNIYFNYFNGAAANFNALSYPFTNDITASLKEGKGYFRLGSFPKYIYIVLDDVTKM